MQSRARLMIAGCITVVVGLIIFFPARVAYQWFAPTTVSLGGISGSVWKGETRQATLGSFYLQDLSWRIKPLSLITGKLDYRVAASPASGFIDGQVALNMSGGITISDLRGSMPLQMFERAINVRGLRGTLNVQFERLIVENGLPVAANGYLEVSNLVASNIHRSSIGGYRAEFFTQDSGVIASVEDTDGLIDIAGRLQLSPDRTYQFLAQLAAKNNTPANIKQQLQYLGSANERGQHELRLEGEL